MKELTIKCVCDNELPEEFEEAGNTGRLQVHSVIGWIDLTPEDFDGGRCGCVYRILQR